ncbi:pentatricopeptide repeat-containing protein At5g44230 [Andrographis paniculata]|uniref:pentatricopeptide repeat-containing protein At5g44230 n=1 Tax=Andrographis paniculata TaxID=175694 RepID=UPI0021E98DA0|nr:pentatricopeptide repeat-containing protein At5g44230 [Andrographis paniculata]
MASLSQKQRLIAPIIRASIPTELPLPFVPFSQLQQIKQLESQVIRNLHGCTSLAQIKETHAYIIRKCLHQSSYICAKLIRMLTKLDVPTQSYGASVFSQVRYPNPFLYTALIRGYLIGGMLRESVRVYKSMREHSVTPVSFTFTAFLKMAAAEMYANLGVQFHGEMLKLGVFSEDVYVGNGLIDMYVKCGWVDAARKVFDEMPERDLISRTLLIDAYAKAGDMDTARKLFDELPVKDAVASTAMVTGFVHNGKPKEALEYFERMQSARMATDEVALVGVINACAQLGTVKYAEWVRNIAESSGFNPTKDVQIGSALIDMYSKCGCVDEACKLFNVMQEKNVYSYSSMILGLAIHGRASSAIELFEEMLATDVKPNGVTFVGVLTACSHAGLVEQGKRIFHSMEACYGVKPSVDHYSCVVDLLGRSGKLEEAAKIVECMPVEANSSIWGALLSACRINVNPEVAEVAARHLFKLEPENMGNYILLADVYAKAGKWEDVLRIRKLTRKKGLRKSPGYSWVEGEKGVVHEFSAWDVIHPRFGEIRETLEKLIDRLKMKKGYEPNLGSVMYNISDEEKRKILIYHSEKMALAYAVMTTEDGSTIRIVKNLRICEDCHAFMCCASGVLGREIIVRDNLRFHHFLEGSCSCANFW